ARDHLPDRTGFAAVARRLFGIEPVEATLAVIGKLLLRHQQCETVMLRERGPTGAEIVAGSGLTAAMQHYDQSGRGLEVFRHIGEHPEIARIGAKSGDLSQRTVEGLPRAPSKVSQAIDSVQLRQLPQKFDVFGKVHWQLLGEDVST